MKRLLLIGLPLLFISLGNAQIEYNINDIIERDSVYYKKYSDELVNGEVFKMFGSKEVPLGLMKEGKKDGKWTDWYENGQKISEETYKEGERDGLYTYWYENGQKDSEGTYKNGKLDGLYTEYYENGQKSFEGTYKNGKGVKIFSGWLESGQKYWEENCKDGEQDCVMIFFYKNGQKAVEGKYKNEKMIPERCWDENGNKCECNELGKGCE